MPELEGRTVIVTGGAGDLGATYCRHLARAGANVVIADVAGSTHLVTELSNSGGNAIGVTVDVADPVSVSSMVAQTLDAYGTIDVLINNAALFKAIRPGPFEDIDSDEWDEAMAVNVRGAWQCARAVTPTMRRAGGGKIINVSSNTVWKGTPGFLHYVTSKSALVGFTRALARELGDAGITVNTVAPDYIPDEQLQQRFPSHDEAVVATRSLKRTQVPDDMAGLIVFLSGPGSDFITGQSFLVNGGAHFQ